MDFCFLASWGCLVHGAGEGSKLVGWGIGLLLGGKEGSMPGHLGGAGGFLVMRWVADDLAHCLVKVLGSQKATAMVLSLATQ